MVNKLPQNSRSDIYFQNQHIINTGKYLLKQFQAQKCVNKRSDLSSFRYKPELKRLNINTRTPFYQSVFVCHFRVYGEPHLARVPCVAHSCIKPLTPLRFSAKENINILVEVVKIPRRFGFVRVAFSLCCNN